MRIIKKALMLPRQLTGYVLRQLLLLGSNRNSIFRRQLRAGLLLALAGLRAVPALKSLVKRAVAHLPSANSLLLDFARAHRPSKQPNDFQLLSVFQSAGVEEICGALHPPLPKGLRVVYYYVDHTVGCPVNTGMQRVVRGLARSFMDAGERLYFVKWDFDSSQLVLINRDELTHLACWRGPELTSEETAQYPLADSPNVVISAHHISDSNWLVVPEVTHINHHPAAVTLDVIMAAKRLGLKTAFVFYDATPLRRQELASMASMHEKYMQQLLLADLLVPISEWVASDLVAFFKYHELATESTIPNIITLPLTGESQLSPKATAASQSTRRLILSVGSISPHKNQLLLVQAFEAFTLRHPEGGWELALVGNIHHDLVAELATFTIRTPSIKVFNAASDDELDRLLHECAFTVFPSVMEGFGLPILESLWYGKPCICADFGAMAEVATGGGCLMVDVRSSDTILSAIERLVFEPETLLQLQAEALARPLSGWSDYAKGFGDAMNRVSDPLNRIGVVYFWIDHTCIDITRSDVQRIVSEMARALIEIGVRLVPVKWDRELQSLFPLSQEDLINISRWGGPQLNDWAPWQEPTTASLSDWLLISEPLMDVTAPEGVAIKRYTTKFRLRTARLFYGVMPWKISASDLPGETKKYDEYVQGLNECELILAVSEIAQSDLVGLLRGSADRVPNLEERVCVCELPVEFKEGANVLQMHIAQADAAINEARLRDHLTAETRERLGRTWIDYARDVVMRMANERQLPNMQQLPPIPPLLQFQQDAVNLSSQPLLSICISTYNRAAWLGLNLKNICHLIPPGLNDVEIIVCDNASTDNTPEVVKPYMGRSDFRYCRNLRNVGMLGNLRVTAHHARGRYVWIIGDDDLIKPGSIERVLKVLREHSELALIYLNYAHTREDDAAAVTDIGCFLAKSTPAVVPGPDLSGPVWRVSTESDNFFTAIYCLVFRRDHALRAYSQNTEGKPFSTMRTSIPTAYYVLNYMMDEDAYWVGTPLLVVNLNVSWIQYAPIWILERLPEAFDIAEKMGADLTAMDKCRAKHVPQLIYWFGEIYQNDMNSNMNYFSPARLISRFKHLASFRKAIPNLMADYESAHLRGVKGAEEPTAKIFPTFQ